MDQKEWKQKYIGRLIELKFPIEFAIEIYEVSLDGHDYTLDPIDAANAAIEDLSYWGIAKWN